MTIVFDHTPPPAPSIAQAVTPTGLAAEPDLDERRRRSAVGLRPLRRLPRRRRGRHPDDADLPRREPRDARTAPVRRARGRRRGQRVGRVAAAHRHLRHRASADADQPERADADERAGAHVDGVERRQHGRLRRRRLPRLPRRPADRDRERADLRRRIAHGLRLARLLGHRDRRGRQREPGIADARRGGRPRPAGGAAGPDRDEPDAASHAHLGRRDRRRSGTDRHRPLQRLPRRPPDRALADDQLRRHARHGERPGDVHGARRRPRRQRQRAVDPGRGDRRHERAEPAGALDPARAHRRRARSRSRSRRSTPRARRSATRSGTSETAAARAAPPRTCTTRRASTR